MKKSIVISLLTVACIFGTAICSFASTGIVTTDTLRLREDASTNASILALLSIDDKVEILEKQNGWYKVKAGDEEGYVSADYIKVIEETEKTPEETNVEEEENNTEEKPAENTEIQEVKNTIKTLPAEISVYITPVINSLVIDKTTEEKNVTVLSEVNGWSYITAGDIKGWVRTENIAEKEATENEIKNNDSSQKIGYISGNSVNFRKEANTSSEVISALTKNTQVKIIETTNGWSKVEYNGEVGYVSSEYISNKKLQTTSRSSVNRKATVSVNTSNSQDTVVNPEVQGNATGEQIVDYAMQFVGYKYVYGGASPSGFDCSGFTQYVYKQFGYSLNRVAASQRLNGVGVDKANMQPGDVICFSNSRGSSSIGHVGIYIGGGKFVHAANSRRGVIISNVDGDGFYYVCARRIIN